MPRVLPKYEASKNRVYGSYIYRCRCKNIPFKITKHQFITICERDCHYCGAKPTPTGKVSHGRFNGIWKCNSLDRIDNSKGYLLSNVQACCSMCNQLKSNRDEKDFLSHITQISLNLGLVFKEED